MFTDNQTHDKVAQSGFEQVHTSSLAQNNSDFNQFDSLKSATEQFQKNLIEQTLLEHDLNWAAAARTLKLDRANLVRLAKRLGISVKKSI